MTWRYELPKGWRWEGLPTLLSTVIDNRGRSAPTATYGIPLIATNCISNAGLYPEYKNIRYVSEETYRTWFRGHPKPGDIIFVNKGTPGLTCQVPDPVGFCFAQDMVALRADEKVVDREYLLAALRNPHFLEQVQAFSVGTTIPHLKKGDFTKLVIPVAPREVQEFVGRLYCDLSRKIEVNRRINRTLEAVAQALYRHWFVDFGPFQNGEFVESELGPIPAGWGGRALYDWAEYINGVAFKDVDFSPQGLPVVKIAELKSGITGQTKFTQSELDPKYKINDGEILFAWSGSPDTSINTFLWSGGSGWLNQHIFKVMPHRPVERSFVYFLLRSLRRKFVEIARNKQTTGLGHVTVRDMKAMKLVLPPDEVMQEFSRLSNPLLQQILQGELEIRALASTRDYLLPKLLSGEIPVEAAAEMAEEGYQSTGIE